MVSEALGRIFGDEARNILHYVQYDWSCDDWAGGCVPCPPPGLLTSCGSMLAEPIDRIYWAGAETSEVWDGHFEGAVSAGERAARQVLIRLQSEGSLKIRRQR